MKTIEFQPQKPEVRKRRSNPNSRTHKIIDLITRQRGATVTEITKAINSVKGKTLTPNQVATQWIVPSYLAVKGIGVVSEPLKNGGDLRIYGYHYGEKVPQVEKPKKTQESKKVAANDKEGGDEKAA